jgi:hypothetical protein
MQKITNTDLKAESIRAALAAIAENNNGYLDPALVVQTAREESSVLHDEFEWDDDAAANQYRLAQAGALIRRVKFTVVKQATESKEVVISTTRAYQSRPSKRRGEEKGYESVQDIMRDPDKRDELIHQVLREMNAYRKRYADLIALTQVWNAIDDAIAEIGEAPTGQGKAGQAPEVRA